MLLGLWVGAAGEARVQLQDPLRPQVRLPWPPPLGSLLPPGGRPRTRRLRPRSRQEAVAATYQVPAPKSQEGTVLLPVGPTPLLSPHLQVLQSLVCGGRVREAAGPEWSEVGRVKLVVLLLVLKVVVEPGALVLIPQEGCQGCHALPADFCTS